MKSLARFYTTRLHRSIKDQSEKDQDVESVEVYSSANGIVLWNSPVEIFSMKDPDKFNGVLCCFYPIGVKWGTGSKVQRVRIKAGTTKIGILKSFSCNA